MTVIRRSTCAVILWLAGATVGAAQGTPDIRWMRGGHTYPVLQLVYSSDGTFFASVSGDNTVKIWRASDALLLRTLIAPQGSGALALSPDNSTICAGGASDDTRPLVRCWHVADGTVAWTATNVPNTNPGDTVGKLDFSPDGQRLASAIAYRLPIFDASDGTYLTDFRGTFPSFYDGGLKYSPNGQFLAVNTAGDFPGLALLDAITGSLVWNYGASTISVAYDVAFSPDSQLVTSVNSSGIRVFGTFDHLQRSFDGGLASVKVAFSPSGGRVATGYAYSGSLDLWNASTGSIVRQWDAHGASGSPPTVVFTADSSKLLSGNLDIKRWKASDGSFDSLLSGQVAPVWLASMSANEQVVATATSPRSGPASIDEHVISLFRASDGALLRYIDFGPSVLRGLTLSPDGKHVAAADDAGLKVWNVSTGNLEHSHVQGGQSSVYRPLAYTPDGSAIAEGGSSMPEIWKWDPSADSLTYITGGPASVLKFLPAPDGRLVVAQQNPVAPPTVVEIVTLAGHIDHTISGLSSVSALAVSPDGQTIAASGVDGSFSPAYVARTWRVSDGATLQTFVGHTRNLSGVGFAWDSQSVVTGAQDATVRVWRASDATQLRLYDAETYVTVQQNPNTYPGVWSLVSSGTSARFLYGRGDATVVMADNPEAAPAILTFSAPADITGGCKPGSAKIVLDRPAPPAGLTVALASSSPGVSVPATVAFKSGATSKSFKITTTALGAAETATVTATLGGQSVDRDVTIHPIGVVSVTLSPNPAIGGGTVSGSVTLECAAAPGDVVVTLSSGAPSVAQPATPAITILHGAAMGTFTVTTVTVTATKKVSIKAKTTPDAKSKSKTLTITP